MPCKDPNTPMVFLRVGEIAPARDGNDLFVHRMLFFGQGMVDLCMGSQQPHMQGAFEAAGFSCKDLVVDWMAKSSATSCQRGVAWSKISKASAGASVDLAPSPSTILDHGMKSPRQSVLES